MLSLPVSSKTKSPACARLFFPCCVFYECNLQLICGSSHVAAVTALIEAPEPSLLCAERSQLSQPHSSLYWALQKSHQSEQRAGITSLDLQVMLLLMYYISLCWTWWGELAHSLAFWTSAQPSSTNHKGTKMLAFTYLALLLPLKLTDATMGQKQTPSRKHTQHLFSTFVKFELVPI